MDSTSAMLAAPAPPAAEPYVAPAYPQTTTDTMAAAAISHGLLTREQVGEGMAAEAAGERYDPHHDPDAPVDRFAHIEPAFRPPDSPADYRFPVAPPGVYPATQTGLEHSLGLQRHIRDVAHDVGLDQGFLADMVDRGNKAALMPKKSDAEREMYARTSRAELARAWGDATDTNLATVQAFIGEIVKKYPSVKTLLEANGLGNDPSAIRLFHTRAMARKKG